MEMESDKRMREAMLSLPEGASAESIVRRLAPWVEEYDAEMKGLMAQIRKSRGSEPNYALFEMEMEHDPVKHKILAGNIAEFKDSVRKRYEPRK